MKEPDACAILLAAGESLRFGGDKLSLKIEGEAILMRAARAIAESGLQKRIVIVGEQSVAHADALEAAGFSAIFNPHAKRGISSSIREGVKWAKAHKMSGVIIALADMPFVTTKHYDRLLRKAKTSKSGIVYTRCNETRSPPVYFAARHFQTLESLTGDKGARSIIESASVEDGVDAPAGLCADIDTLSDFLSFVDR